MAGSTREMVLAAARRSAPGRDATPWLRSGRDRNMGAGISLTVGTTSGSTTRRSARAANAASPGGSLPTSTTPARCVVEPGVGRPSQCFSGACGFSVGGCDSWSPAHRRVEGGNLSDLGGRLTCLSRGHGCLPAALLLVRVARAGCTRVSPETSLRGRLTTRTHSPSRRVRQRWQRRNGPASIERECGHAHGAHALGDCGREPGDESGSDRDAHDQHADGEPWDVER